MNLPKHLVGLALLVMASSGLAQSISVGSGSGPPGGGTTPTPIPVTFTRNPSVPVADFAVRITFNTAILTATPASANGGTCAQAPVGTITVLPPAGLSDVPTNVYCNITFTIAGTAPTGPTPLNIAFAPGGQCIQDDLTVVPCQLNPGTITVVAGATGPSISYAPAAGATAGTGGPVNLPTGPIGGSGTANIVATPSGGTAGGVTTVGSCTVLGVNAPAFTAPPGNLTFTAPTTTPQNLVVGCTRAATALTADLRCTETVQGGATTNRFWVLNCPAGTPVPVGPTLTYSPVPTTTINFPTPPNPGANVNATINITPTGGVAGAGATTTFGNCVLSGANPGAFAVLTTLPLSFPAPGSGTATPLNLRCTGAATAQTATLTCQETIGPSGTPTNRVWPLSCPAAPTAPIFGSTPAPGTTINFGNVQIPNSGNQSITVTNTGTAALNVSNCTVTGAGFTLLTPATFTVAPGGNATITVRFTPSTPGPATGTLTCTHNAQAPTQVSWPLSATGVAPLVTAIPVMGQFGLWILVGLIAGLGLVVLVARRG